jgi:hypothetical protein
MKILMFFTLFIAVGQVNAFESLDNGVAITDENFSTVVPISMEYAVADLGLIKGDGVVKSFYKVVGGNNLYSLTSKSKIYLTNFETREVLGNWPLSPWASATRMKGEGITWKVRPALSAVKGGDYIEITDPGLHVLDNTAKYTLDPYTDSLGCLSNTPLRYGDINADTNQELVLFLQNDLLVFSLENKKIIFSTNLHNADELKPERVEDWFLDETTVNPQHVAQSGTNNLIKAALPATRSFAKIYMDDFNSDGNKDIIVWRKLYESNLKTNPVLGFTKVGDLLVHYSLIDGEYQLQTNKPAVDGEFETDDAQQTQLKGWLTAKNQTWQSGFPSKSECAGQEGQLIPEMHDPLLNDPDVLK